VVSYFLRYFSSTSTEQISPDSAGLFTSFDPVGFAIFATLRAGNAPLSDGWRGCARQVKPLLTRALHARDRTIHGAKTRLSRANFI
jgi:hypothetical protein